MASIQRALTVRLLVSLSTVVAVATVGLAWILRVHLQDQFDEALAGKARVLSAFVQRNEQGQLEMELEDVPMVEFDHPGGEYFVVWDNHEVQFRSRSLADGTLPPINAPVAQPIALPILTPIFRDARLPDSRAGRVAWLSFSPRVEPGEPNRSAAVAPTSPGLLTIAVARERQTLNARLTDLNLEIGGLALLLLAAIPLVIARVVPHSLRPLEDVARRAAAIDATSLGQRFPTEGLPAELAAITGRLNELLDRLAKSFERERRFSADVAHELRTPIAELRSLAEVALAGNQPHDGLKAGDVSLLEDVLGAAIQMQNLVTNLLALARCESGHQPIKMEKVDAAAALMRVWANFQSAASDKRLKIDWHALAAADVRADSALLDVVFSNLLGNAMTYAPAGGRIVLSAAPKDDQMVIAIGNTNDTITSDDLPHLFEAFWRKDSARTDGGHSGLGLSLVAAMLSLMGGRIHASLNPPGWIQFVVELPSLVVGDRSVETGPSRQVP